MQVHDEAGSLKARDSFLVFEDIDLYPYPNPALANILLSARMQGIIAKGIAKILTVFLNIQAAEVYRDPKRQFRAGGHPPGQLMAQTTASVDVGSAAPGKPADRWTGQITVGVEYAGAEFYGRKAYAQYAGNRNLQQALRAVFPSV
jgi:hypothetical protein